MSYIDRVGIELDGKRVCDYIWSLSEVDTSRIGRSASITSTIMTTSLDKADLTSVKAALDSVSAPELRFASCFNDGNFI
nr:hypothetical protein [Burkholderia ubonensis]